MLQRQQTRTLTQLCFQLRFFVTAPTYRRVKHEALKHGGDSLRLTCLRLTSLSLINSSVSSKSIREAMEVIMTIDSGRVLQPPANVSPYFTSGPSTRQWTFFLQKEKLLKANLFAGVKH